MGNRPLVVDNLSCANLDQVNMCCSFIDPGRLPRTHSYPGSELFELMYEENAGEV